MQISYIIPAYNCSKTIKDTVRSIVKYNTNLKYEIIIVENGSTDSTIEVLNSLEEEYKAVKVFKSKKGVSRARNKGIEEASGKWIWFIDADDKICFDVSNLLKQSTRVNLIMGNYKINNKSTELIKKNNSLDGVDYKNYKLFMISNPTRYMTVWTKIFKLDIIKKYNLKFDEKLKVAEDSNFTFSYLLNSDSIKLFNKTIYSYSTLNSSTMRTIDLSRINEYVKAMTEIEKNIQNKDVALKKAVYKYISSNFFISMVRNVFASSDLNWRCKIKILKETKNKDIYQKAFKNISINDIKNSKKLIPALFLKRNMIFIPAIVFDIKAKINRKKEK